ncbi:MAG: radical SAM protein [Nanoarchaeota archaeon]|nr:radical SAM protein [Nanoarchaeota archaeon]
MKVLFIIPSGGKDLYGLGKQGKYIPLGIAQVAACLEEDGHNVKVIDQRLQDIDVKAFAKRFSPDIIGFSLSFFSKDESYKMAHELGKKAILVAGGQYATLFPEECLDNGFDVAIIGEGDYAINEILKRRDDLGKVKGIAFKKKGKIIRTPSRPAIEDLDSLPYPAIHLFSPLDYIPLPKHYRELPVYPMITSRGCKWGKCIFCYQPTHARRMSPSRAVDEIEYMQGKYKFREIRFWDDIFIDDTSWAVDFCDELDKRGIKISWSAHARTDWVTKKTLMRVAKSGCWQILYGIESGDETLLRKVGKGTTIAQARNAIRWTKEARIETRISFILGLPGETPELADKTIQLAKELEADVTQFSLATPYPGTKMHELYHDKILNDDFCEVLITYLPEGYKSTKELEEKFRKAYRTIYFNPKYLFKRISAIRTYQDLKKNLSGLRVALRRAR